MLGLKRRGFTAPAFVGAPAAKRPAVGAAKPVNPVSAKLAVTRLPAAAAGRSATIAAAQPGEALYFTVLYCKYQVRSGVVCTAAVAQADGDCCLL